MDTDRLVLDVVQLFLIIVFGLASASTHPVVVYEVACTAAHADEFFFI